MRANHEQVAATSIAGVAENYATGNRHTRNEALQRNQDQLRMWKIRPDRIAEGLAKAATNYVDSDAWRADVGLQLLVDAGASVERARAIRAAQPRATCADYRDRRRGPRWASLGAGFLERPAYRR